MRLNKLEYIKLSKIKINDETLYEDNDNKILDYRFYGTFKNKIVGDLFAKKVLGFSDETISYLKTNYFWCNLDYNNKELFQVSNKFIHPIIFYLFKNWDPQYKVDTASYLINKELRQKWFSIKKTDKQQNFSKKELDNISKFIWSSITNITSTFCNIIKDVALWSSFFSPFIIDELKNMNILKEKDLRFLSNKQKQILKKHDLHLDKLTYNDFVGSNKLTNPENKEFVNKFEYNIKLKEMIVKWENLHQSYVAKLKEIDALDTNTLKQRLEVALKYKILFYSYSDLCAIQSIYILSLIDRVIKVSQLNTSNLKQVSKDCLKNVVFKKNLFLDINYYKSQMPELSKFSLNWLVDLVCANENYLQDLKDKFKDGLKDVNYINFLLLQDIDEVLKKQTSIYEIKTKYDLKDVRSALITIAKKIPSVKKLKTWVIKARTKNTIKYKDKIENVINNLTRIGLLAQYEEFLSTGVKEKITHNEKIFKHTTNIKK